MMRALLGGIAAAGLLATAASAHDGRRLEVKVVGNQLIAQGYLSGANPVDDGAGLIRPYINTIHGHWVNNPLDTIDSAFATLPGFDVPVAGPLAGFDLTMTLERVEKWDNVPPMPPAGTVPALETLTASDDAVFVRVNGITVSSLNPGTVTLASELGSTSVFDVDPVYDIGAEPAGSLYVVTVRLATDAPGVADSDPVSIILSPDGVGPMERLHHASLFLESQLGLPTPDSCDCETDGDATEVGIVDLLVYVGTWLDRRAFANRDGDGDIDAADLLLFLDCWFPASVGTTCE